MYFVKHVICINSSSFVCCNCWNVCNFCILGILVFLFIYTYTCRSLYVVVWHRLFSGGFFLLFFRVFFLLWFYLFLGGNLQHRPGGFFCSSLPSLHYIWPCSGRLQQNNTKSKQVQISGPKHVHKSAVHPVVAVTKVALHFAPSIP